MCLWFKERNEVIAVAVIAFIRRSDQPSYKIKKASQAIWVEPNGDVTFNLECIIDLTEVSDSQMNEVIVIVYGEISPENVAEENDLFLNAEFCDYLYNGWYERRSEQFVKLLVTPTEHQYVKIAQIRNIETTPRGSYSRIRIFFRDHLRAERSDTCGGKMVKYAGFRIRYTIPKYAKKIKRHLYTEATWTISVRPYDNKVLGTLARNEKIVDLDFLYYWVVLPRGFFVTAYSPTLHQIRDLEIDPWKRICPKLQKDSICYSWKLESPSKGARLHLDFREPPFDPYWAFWAFLITAAALLLTLLFFIFE